MVIATPKDGSYSSMTYHDSGQDTANAIEAAFARYTDKVNISTACIDVQCLTKEYPSQAAYYIVPQILHWEDRATEWSTIPDKIEIKISVYKSSDLSLINSVILNGSSKIATWGGDHPQDLLAAPINTYVATLY